MSYNLVAYTTVTNEFKGKAAMLDNCFMTSLDEAGNELFSTSIGDFIFAFIANAATLFNGLEHRCSINRSHELNTWFDNLHILFLTYCISDDGTATAVKSKEGFEFINDDFLLALSSQEIA